MPAQMARPRVVSVDTSFSRVIILNGPVAEVTSGAGFSLWSLVVTNHKIHRLNRLGKNGSFYHSERSEESLFDLCI
jgi:hypothetical protein